jgi:hypothetical protein
LPELPPAGAEPIEDSAALGKEGFAMSSHPIVRRLTTAAALFLVLASAPALAAPGPTSAHGPHAPRVPVVTGLTLLDQLLDWLGFPATGDRPDVRGTHEKSGPGLPLTSGLPDLMHTAEQERGGMIDPNG